MPAGIICFFVNLQHPPEMAETSVEARKGDDIYGKAFTNALFLAI